MAWNKPNESGTKPKQKKPSVMRGIMKVLIVVVTATAAFNFIFFRKATKKLVCDDAKSVLVKKEKSRLIKEVKPAVGPKVEKTEMSEGKTCEPEFDKNMRRFVAGSVNPKDACLSQNSLANRQTSVYGHPIISPAAVPVSQQTIARELFEDIFNDRVYRMEGKSLCQIIPKGNRVTGKVAKTAICGLVKILGGNPELTFRAAFDTGERVLELDERDRVIRTIDITRSWLAEFWRRHQKDKDIMTRGSTVYCRGDQ